MQGKIVSWSTNKYYGFVKPDNSANNIFFPGQSVQLPPGETVAIGDCVEFDTAPDRRHPDRPPIAINIKVVKRADVPVRERTHPQRYLREDMRAEGNGELGRHLRAAEALFRAGK